MDTFESMTVKEERMDLIVRTILKRAQSTLVSVMPDVVDLVDGPDLSTPIMDLNSNEKQPKLCSIRSILKSVRQCPDNLSPQGEDSQSFYTIEASCQDILKTNESAQARSKFRARVMKILDDKKARLIGKMTAKDAEVIKIRASLKKKPRDAVLIRALEDLRLAQNAIDDSLVLIEKIAEEIKATANLDDLPIMSVYRDDLDLESLVNSPTDLGTAFMAYVSRAKATNGQEEMIKVVKKGGHYRDLKSFTPTDKTGSFTRDMDAAIRNLKYNDGFVGPATINDKAVEVEQKLRND
ncbi:hypothetical protein ACOME3_010420, partial [Neoechinorhynchus agilis]